MNNRLKVVGAATGVFLMASLPAVAATLDINFETGYEDNELLTDGVALLDSSGVATSVTLVTVNDNTMSVEASGDANDSAADNPPDGFVNDPLGGGNDDEESAVETSALGDFFLRTTGALSFNAGAVNPVFSLLFGDGGAGMVSAEIWDIDGNTSQGTEKWTLNAFSSGGAFLGTIDSPEFMNTSDAGSLNGQAWTFTFEDIGAIGRIDFNFTGTKTTGIGVAFDNLTVAPVPLPAAGLLLLGGLGGLVAVRRRRKAA